MSDQKGYTELLKYIGDQIENERLEYEQKRKELDDSWNEAMSKVKKLKASYKEKKEEYEKRLSDMGADIAHKEKRIKEFLQTVKDFVEDMGKISSNDKHDDMSSKNEISVSIAEDENSISITGDDDNSIFITEDDDNCVTIVEDDDN